MFELWNRLKSKEIEMRQNGRYIEFYKRNSRIMFKIDLADNYRIIKVTRSTDEENEYNDRSFNNFFNAKIITHDAKLALMFQYAEWVCNTNQTQVKLYDILYRFRVPALKRFEKWVSIGTTFDRRGWGWGNENEERTIIHFNPSDVPKEVRDYIANKTWTITDLDNICRMTENNDDEVINQIFKELTDHPEYEDVFQYVVSGGTGAILNLFNDNVLSEISSITKTYNLNIDRLMYYMNYLYNVEGVCLAAKLSKYKKYLEMELEKQHGRKNKMYKYPRYFMSVVHKYNNIATRNEIANNMEVSDDYVYKNEFLEYEDEEFKFMIPHSAADVRNEARQQGHCLETRFMNHLENGRTGVVFMRRIEEIEKALITIEVRDKRVRQMCIGDNNRVPEEYRPHIYNWADEVGVKIDEDSWKTMLDV